MTAGSGSPFGGTIDKTVAGSKPWWPQPVKPPEGAPNILVVLFDDVGFSDFGCYGSAIRTPTIDKLAAQGLRYSGFHTTAMCSTTRAALLTGRNHHSVGVGCLANFDSGYPGYRGKIARDSGTLAEMLRPHGYRNYMVGKWHVTPLTESGATGPFDGWPLGRGFDRFYGFLDAETDQFAPELVSDNTHVDPPGTYADGYHLTSDLIDQSIRFIADHTADRPDIPWLTWVALGACHAPHQAPADIIKSYDEMFAHGWDVEREQRMARQKAMGIVPPETRLPARNGGVKAWEEHSADEKRVFTRLQAAFAGMLDRADARLARLFAFPATAGIRHNTLLLVLSDNGASQEGGPLGFVNAMGPYNFRPEPIAEKLRRIDDIGGPDSHSNFPHGWAMASNTPLRRYKQNTHGGGIRDPFVMTWPKKIAAKGEVRHQFVHACDLTPTLLDLIGIAPPAEIGHVPTDVAPDVRSRSYTIEAHVEIGDDGAEGVLIAHGDATSGYSLYIKDGVLVHDLNIGGGHEIVTSNRNVPSGAHRLGMHVERLVRKEPPAKGSRTGVTAYTLLIDGEAAGSIQTQLAFNNFISWSGLDIGRDRSSPVSHYAAPFEFTGQLLRVTVDMHDDQKLDGEGVGAAEMARQ